MSNHATTHIHPPKMTYTTPNLAQRKALMAEFTVMAEEAFKGLDVQISNVKIESYGSIATARIEGDMAAAYDAAKTGEIAFRQHQRRNGNMSIAQTRFGNSATISMGTDRINSDFAPVRTITRCDCPACASCSCWACAEATATTTATTPTPARANMSAEDAARLADIEARMIAAGLSTTIMGC